ncbi:MAG: hypothetical protein GXO35_00870 [Gammaproteobacteria bacterium]|nr:hypothetical protein [Gammaproteobacteria bacterium]
MQPTLAGIDNDGYLTRSFHAILECFEDVGHYTRQQLRELLHIPNVQTLRSESDAHRHEICLELQPNNLDDYLELVRFVQTGQFQTSVENNVKVGGQTFLGTIDVRLEHSSTLNVLKYFCPDVFRRNTRRLKELVKQDKLDEMTTLVKTQTAADMKTGGRVVSLRVMCATEIYVSILTSNDSSPFEYLRQVKKLGCPDFLTEIRTSDGYNALHLAVLEKKEEFLKMLFYANKWTALGNDFVKPVNVSQECPHNGYSPRRLAEALSYTNAGYEMLLMFDEYDRLMRYMPDLHKACLMGCLQFAVAMIESRHHLIEVKDEQNANCLFYASASGNAKLVNFLLKKGAPRNTPNTVGETPLHIAAMFGHLDVLEVMSNYFFEIRGTVNVDGYNAVCYAARFSDMDTLKLYKQKGFTIDALALTTAVKYQQDGVFKFILADVKDVNKGADKEGRLALHHAVITGNAHAVKELLSKGADLSKLDKYGRNVFHLAAEFGRKDIVNILLNEAKKTGKKCLETLIGARDVLNIGELLVVVRGKDCGRKAWHVVQLNRWSTKAFQRAMKSGQIDVIKYGQILRSGFGKAADEETRKMIEKRKEDVLNNRHEDMTPLHIAAMQDNDDIVKILLSSGAPSAVQDYYGATPAHYAAMNDNATLMDLLCQAGARLDVKTNDGLTALQVAEINSSALVINYIKASQPIREARVSKPCPIS